jgi:hypothetical protein
MRLRKQRLYRSIVACFEIHGMSERRRVRNSTTTNINGYTSSVNYIIVIETEERDYIAVVRANYDCRHEYGRRILDHIRF